MLNFKHSVGGHGGGLGGGTKGLPRVLRVPWVTSLNILRLKLVVSRENWYEETVYQQFYDLIAKLENWIAFRDSR